MGRVNFLATFRDPIALFRACLATFDPVTLLRACVV